VTGTLAEVASGKNGQRISLQRFVLSVLLDDVLIEASYRLTTMSKGRYQLLRRQDRTKGNVASGLDLDVEDAYTGKTRPVNTLSGGESFMAALALALGLSDVVQAYAGGIRLDALFIDEGFGSLDPDSLDLAIETLMELRANGRSVGIISHVAELKEQIAQRIDVRPSQAGSKIEIVST
jgi:exonuclease SbcC